MNQMNPLNKQIRFIILLFILIIIVASIFIGLNLWRYHYTGNNYFPADGLKIGITFVLIYIGSWIYSGPSSKMSLIALHLMAYYCLLAMIALLTNAAQYTPFALIDQSIEAIETNWLHVNLMEIVTWTHQHMTLGRILVWVYNSLSLEMVICPFLLIVTLQRTYLYEYFILMSMTALIGFCFYYFYPSNGPASVFESHYFTASQLATEIKFSEVHHYLQPSTLEGGLIALPSFHTIWACLITYAMRSFKPLFIVLIFYNSVIIMACILLGWHYFIDLFSGLLVVFIAYKVYAMNRMPAKWIESRVKNVYPIL